VPTTLPPQHLVFREKKEPLGKFINKGEDSTGVHAENNAIGLFYLVAVVCSACPHEIRPSRIQTPGVSWHSFTFCTIIKIIVKTVAMLIIMLIRPYHTSSVSRPHDHLAQPLPSDVFILHGVCVFLWKHVPICIQAETEAAARSRRRRTEEYVEESDAATTKVYT